MTQKIFRAPLGLKADVAGQFRAVFSTLNTLDRDNDVTVPGAFGVQKCLVEPWNHDYSRPPVGQGTVREEGNEAIIFGQFFLNTASGLEHYEIAKQLGDLQEWSYSFTIDESEPGTFKGQRARFLKKLTVLGVGQVTRGAGIATRTTAIKGGDHGRRDFLRLGMTPTTARAAIAKLASPGTVLEVVDAELSDGELAALEALVSARGTSATVRDVLRAEIVAEHGSDHSPDWMDAMIAGSLHFYVEQAYRRMEGQAGVSPNWAEAEAEVTRWARMPVRVMGPKV